MTCNKHAACQPVPREQIARTHNVVPKPPLLGQPVSRSQSRGGGGERLGWQSPRPSVCHTCHLSHVKQSGSLPDSQARRQPRVANWAGGGKGRVSDCLGFSRWARDDESSCIHLIVHLITRCYHHHPYCHRSPAISYQRGGPAVPGIYHMCGAQNATHGHGTRRQFSGPAAQRPAWADWQRTRGHLQASTHRAKCLIRFARGGGSLAGLAY